MKERKVLVVDQGVDLKKIAANITCCKTGPAPYKSEGIN